jgi:hypothetical protein
VASSTAVTLKYPEKLPFAELGPSFTDSYQPEFADYVKFSRYSFKNAGGAQYFNVPDNTNKTNKQLITSAYIAMPANLSADYAANYQQANLGALGRAATGALAANSSADVAQSIQKAAKAGLPESAFNNLAQGIQGVGSLVGLNTDGISPNTLTAISQGKVFNPYSEQVFEGVGFRTFNFNFKMVARSEKEAQSIQDILEMFKVGMLPAFAGGGDGDGGSLGGLLTKSSAAQRFLTVPDKFLIQFVRIGKDTKIQNLDHYKIDYSVCTGMSVNYTPDGQYVAIKSKRLANAYKAQNSELLSGDVGNLQEGQAPGMIYVPAITLDLQFTETSIVTQEKAIAGY